jgi:hypothetical protein
MNGMDVNIICGSRSIPWDRLLTFQNSVAYTACWNYPAHSIMSTQISSSLYTVLTLAYLRELSGLYRGRAPTLGLEDVLDRFSHTHCSVPLDLVYSVLNISNLAGSSIPINYGKTSMEVFSGITKMIIARSRNLIHLACTGLLYSGDVLKPPSWMRDYSRPELPSILVKTRYASRLRALLLRSRGFRYWTLFRTRISPASPASKRCLSRHDFNLHKRS